MRIAAVALLERVSSFVEERGPMESSLGIAELLPRLAEMALGLGPTVSFESPRQRSGKGRGENVSSVPVPSSSGRDGLDGGGTLWVDITGCAHLHLAPKDAGNLAMGERRLARLLFDKVQEQGVRCRVACADGPLVAAAVAHHFPGPERQGALPIFVVPAGRNKDALARLPLEALPTSEEQKRFLLHMGLRTLADLQRLPRESLALRLGTEAPRLLSFLEGDDRTPLSAYVPPAVPEERVELEEGVLGQESLLFVVKGLCDRMAVRLDGRALGAGRLVLEFALDRGLLPRDGDPQRWRSHVEMALPAPLRKATDLFAALRARVESLTLEAPALAVTLRVPELVSMEQRTRDLFIPEAKADGALPRLAAELLSELGPERVGVFQLMDTWVPEARVRLVPYNQKASPGTKAAGRLSTTSSLRGLNGASEPVRFLMQPQPWVPLTSGGLRLLMRLEGVQWWRGGPWVKDYGVGWVEGKGLAWVEVDRETGQRWIRGWMD